jgi:hypothetical protein
MMIVPQLFWDALLHRFLTDRTNLERVAYFDGVRAGGAGVVTTVTVPRAKRHPRYFRVAAADMSAAGKHLLEHGLQRLAQVYSHGDTFVDHSETDDGWAYSQRPGSLSIVVPCHGRDVTRLTQCGVHIRRETGWVRLDEGEIAKEILTVPSSVILA